MEKISVIVPVFNGAAYLEQCVESILTQYHTNLELILINDGSVDRTGAICEDFRKNDARVRVVHKLQNEGLGAARNTGLEMAVGDYILFLDADDWIDPNHISDLYELMIRTESDVAIANFTRYFQADERYELHIFPEDYYEKVLTPPEWFTYQYGIGQNLSLCFTVPWGKLYKKSLFETILYPTDGYGEDDRTTWKLYINADRIAYMHRSSLLYRVNENSMTQQEKDPATIFGLKAVSERLETLSLLGFPLDAEIKAFEWRAGLAIESALKKGDMVAYKQVQFQLQALKKYRK